MSTDGKESGNVFFTSADFGVDFWQTVHAKRKYAACTVFWTIAALSAFGATIYFSSELIVSYLKYESYNQVSQATASSLVLPAFTICNLNMYNITNMDENIEASKMALYNQLVRIIAESDGETLQRISISSFEELDENLDIIRNFSIDPSQQILIGRTYDYRFAGDHYTIDFENDVHAMELGYCINFNDNATLVQYSDGLGGGFEIDLDIMSQFYSQETKSVGLLLFLRHHNEVVFVNDGGIILRPGSEHFVKLTKQEITRMSGFYGTCREEQSNLTAPEQTNSERSIRECKQDVRFELMKEICMCLPFYLYSWFEKNKMTEHAYFDSFSEDCDNVSFRKRRSIKDDNRYSYNKRQAPPDDGQGPPPDDGQGPPPDDGQGPPGPPETLCSNNTDDYECPFTTQQICNGLVKSTLAHTGDDGGDNSGPAAALAAKIAQCYAPCEYSNYHTDIMSSNFPPTERYHESMLRPFTKYNYTFDEAKANLVRVHIYYDDLTVTFVDQTGAYSVSSFIAELGGTFDLFIGVSFYTVLQLLEILFGSILSRVLKLVRPSSVEAKKSHSTDVEVIDVPL